MKILLSRCGVTARLPECYHQSILTDKTSAEEYAYELDIFNKTFWRNEEVDWLECVDNPKEYVSSFFESCNYLQEYIPSGEGER